MLVIHVIHIIKFSDIWSPFINMINFNPNMDK